MKMKQKIIKNRIINLKLYTTSKPITKRTKPFCEFEFSNDEQCNNFISSLNSNDDYITIGSITLKRTLITYLLKEIK